VRIFGSFQRPEAQRRFKELASELVTRSWRRETSPPWLSTRPAP
jgi:hypothetical protein